MANYKGSKKTENQRERRFALWSQVKNQQHGLFHTNLSGCHFTFFLLIYVCAYIHVHALVKQLRFVQIQLDNVYLFDYSNLLYCVNIWVWNI